MADTPWLGDTAGHEHALIVSDDRSFRIRPDELRATTGWELKPEGLCREDICVPVRNRETLLVDGTVDLRAFSELSRRPLALDEETGVAVLGAAAADRAAERASMHVGDFTLTDADGNQFRWASLGRKKKLLFAWASW
ncbi:MAG: hypothetical protein ACT4OX_00120 [Actinomycetota bacterium]